MVYPGRHRRGLGVKHGLAQKGTTDAGDEGWFVGGKLVQFGCAAGTETFQDLPRAGDRTFMERTKGFCDLALQGFFCRMSSLEMGQV